MAKNPFNFVNCFFQVAPIIPSSKFNDTNVTNRGKIVKQLENCSLPAWAWEISILH